MWCYEDKECEEVVDALNRLPGIDCYEWCWGHQKGPFMVRFASKTPKNIRPILGALIDIAPSEGEPPWSLEIELGLGLEDFVFRLRGPVIFDSEAIGETTKALISRLRHRKKAI
jgi:hypothetical protein